MSYFKMPPPDAWIAVEGDSIAAPPIDWRTGINDVFQSWQRGRSLHLFALGCNVLYGRPDRPMLSAIGAWELAALLTRLSVA